MHAELTCVRHQTSLSVLRGADMRISQEPAPTQRSWLGVSMHRATYVKSGLDCSEEGLIWVSQHLSQCPCSVEPELRISANRLMVRESSDASCTWPMDRWPLSKLARILCRAPPILGRRVGVQHGSRGQSFANPQCASSGRSRLDTLHDAEGARRHQEREVACGRLCHCSRCS
jgi:hypothetical protein